MGVDFIVVAVDPSQVIFGADKFVEEAAMRWPECRVYRRDPSRMVADVSVSVAPSGSSSFSVIHYPNNRFISTDAGPEVAAEIAIWVRSLHPDPSLTLWLTAESFSAHVVLHPGITTDEIHTGWVDHREHDPYEEFPQYFCDW